MMNVPVKYIIGLTMYIVLTILVVVLLAVDKLPEFKYILFFCAGGFGLCTAIGAYVIANVSNNGGNKISDPNEPIVFDTCPDYWTERWDQSKKARMCYNAVYDNLGKESLIMPDVGDYTPADANGTDNGFPTKNALRTVNLTDLNVGTWTNKDKCVAAKSIPWTDAYNKCIDVNPLSLYNLSNTPLNDSSESEFKVPSFQTV